MDEPIYGRRGTCPFCKQMGGTHTMECPSDDYPVEVLIDTQLSDAVHRQLGRARESMQVDRRGWSDEQWADDAERLMNEPDGAITSLVNGHVMALLRLTGRND